jgi:hypothetical protein
MGSYFDELMKRDISSLVSNMPSLPSTDLSKFNIGSSVSSDKVFSAVSDLKTTSNVFGVFDSKQVVQELSADISNPFSSELLSSLAPEKLLSTVTKLDTSIVSDLDYNDAISTVMDNVGDLKQSGFSAAGDMFGGSIGDTLGSSKDMLSSIADELSLDTSFIQNISLDSVTEGLIPRNMSLGDFESLKTMFNGPSGLGNFNSCDALSQALAWGSQLINPMGLMDMLGGLFGLLGKYDITGMMQCFQQTQESITFAQRADLGSSLMGNGAISSYSEFLDMGNVGTVSNPYEAATAVGKLSRSSSVSSTNGMSSLFSSLGITEPEDVYNTKNYNTTQNQSILDNVNYPVYNRQAMVETKDNGFLSKCFDDDTDNLLTKIPEMLFG